MLDRTPAKKYGFGDPIPEANNQTPATICESGLESDKMKEKAPAYVQGLRTELAVEILDPTLKAESQELIDSATNPPASAN